MKKYSLLLLLLLIPYYAFAAEDASAYPNLKFTPIDDATCSVGKANEDIKEAIIPSEVTISGKNYIVTKIRDNAFSWCSSLTSVEIPNSVTSIGFSAFAYCGYLGSVVISSTVTKIETTAFDTCESLSRLIFRGSTCPVFVENVFAGVKSCTVYVPKGASVDSYRSELENARLGISKIKTYEHYEGDYPDLVFTPIEGSDGECSVGANKDNSLKGELVIPSRVLMDDGVLRNVTMIDRYGFSSCNELTSVIIPEGVKTIPFRGFAFCPALTSVSLPESMTNIGSHAFYASGLKSIVIPKNVEEIDIAAFYNLETLIFKGESCPNLHSRFLSTRDRCIAYVPEASKDSYESALQVAGIDASRVKGYVDAADCPDLVFTQISGKNGECSVTAANESITGDVVIPSTILKDDGNIYNVISIGNYAFDCCNSLTSVKIPSSVTSIGRGAFIYCNSLTSAKIPSSVTSIGDRAFFTCGTLTSVEISSSVTAIGTYAFAYCTQLKTVIFKGNTYPNIGSDAFDEFNGTVYVLNETLVESFKAKFPDNEVKPLLGFGTEVGTYIMTGDEIAVNYPEGYAPEGLSYSVKEEGVTLTEGEDAFTLTDHGAATVRVADAGNENIYAETTLNVYVSGDSNDNGTVDITDAVTTANYIVGKKPEKFLVIAADVVPSDPSAITIADVVATVDIMLAAPAPEPSDDSKALMAPANSVDFLTLRAAREGIALSLAGQGVFSALQADVTLPAGATLNGVHAGDRLTGNHSVIYRMVDDRTVRVAVFALSLDSFAPGDAVVILDVEGMGAGDLTAANVIASDADGHGYRLGVDGGGMSGIDGVTPGDGAAVSGVDGGIAVTGAAGMTVAVYAMDGRLVKSFTAGDDDRVTVDLVPGVYLVRVGAAPAVKIAVR